MYLEKNQSKLILKHEWTTLPPARPVTQDHVKNANLRLELHGKGGHQLKKSHHDHIPNDPFYLWSGGCQEKWAVSFENKNNDWNFNNSCLTVRTWQSGNAELHIILNLLNFGWIISEVAIKASQTWQITSLILPELVWYPFDISNINWTRNKLLIDLKSVKAIGFSDLTIGESSDKCSRLDYFEIKRLQLHEQN
ncbi:MAG: hypothetical protein AB4058_03805 [Microcystaceae cyanobacterium]